MDGAVRKLGLARAPSPRTRRPSVPRWSGRLGTLFLSIRSSVRGGAREARPDRQNEPASAACMLRSTFRPDATSRLLKSHSSVESLIRRPRSIA